MEVMDGIHEGICPHPEFLAQLLEPAQALACLQRHGLPLSEVRVRGARLKPGQGALVSFDLVGSDGRQAWAYAVVTDPDRVQEVWGKSRSLRPLPSPWGPGVLLLDGGSAILSLFPNDRHLRHLRWVTEMDKLKRILSGLRSDPARAWRIRARRSRLEPVRYKPEQRYLAKAHLSWKDDRSGETEDEEVFLRFFAEPKGQRLLLANRALQESLGTAMVPRGLGALMGGRLYVEEAIHGESLQQILIRGQATFGQELGTLLRRVHNTQLSWTESPSAPSQVTGVLEELSLPASIDPALAQRVARLRDLTAGVPWPTPERSLIHGDFHLQQIILRGGDLVLVDWDLMAVGDCREDLGFFEAQLDVIQRRIPDLETPIEELRRAFWMSYSQGAQRSGPPDLLPFRALGLLKLAWLPFRRLQANWAAEMGGLLDDAIRCFEVTQSARSPAPKAQGTDTLWSVAHPRRNRPWPARGETRSGETTYGLYDPETDAFSVVPPESDPVLAPWLPLYRDATVIARRAGNRAVLRIRRDGQDLYVRVFQPKRHNREQDAWHKARILSSRAPGAPRIPALAGTLVGPGVLELESLPGVALLQSLLGGSRREETLNTVGRALAAWHHAPSGDLLSDVRETDGLDELGEAVSPYVREASAWVAEAPPFPACADLPSLGPCHGDLHDKNILVHGETCGLIDVGGLLLGPPELDLGNLLAHLSLRRLQQGLDLHDERDVMALIQAYQSAAPPLSWSRLQTFRGRTLIRLALIYSFRKPWRALVPRLVAESGNLLREVL